MQVLFGMLIYKVDNKQIFLCIELHKLSCRDTIELAISYRSSNKETKTFQNLIKSCQKMLFCSNEKNFITELPDAVFFSDIYL